MRKLLFLSLFAVVLWANPDVKIKIYTENYPPYNMLVDGKVEGIGVDILSAILKRINSSQSKDDIILTNWSRAYNLALKKKNHMVFSTAKTKERENLFKWVGPIYENTLDLIALKSKNIKIKSLEDIKKYKVGVVLNDLSEHILIQKGFKDNIERVSGKNSFEISFKKLEKNKIDMFAYIKLLSKYSVKNEGFINNNLETVYSFEKISGYFAFNKNTPQSIIDKWQKALDEIKADGTYEKIMKKYD